MCKITQALPGVIFSVLLALAVILPVQAEELHPFTDQENQWLNAHRQTPMRYIIPPKYEPVSFVEEGQPKGIVSEYIHMLSEKLKLKFVLVDVSFAQGLKLANQKQIDFLPCLSRTPERSVYLNFTQEPYLTLPMVIVSRKDITDIVTLDDIKGRRAAVDPDLAAYSKLRTEYRNMDLTFVFKKTVPEVMQTVHLGQADICFASTAVAGYLISQNGWTNLKITAQTDWPETRLRMAVRNDWPLFITIIEKTLLSMDREVREKAFNKWVPVRFEHGLEKKVVYEIILPMAVSGIVIITVVLVFLVILIRKNKKIQAVKEALKKLSVAVEQSPTSVVITDTRGIIEYVNPRFCRVTGYTAREAIGKTPALLKSGQQSPKVYEDLWQTIKAEKTWRGEFLNKKKDGTLFWESAAIAPIKGLDGTVTHYVAIKEDITQRKQMEVDLEHRIMELDQTQTAMRKMMEDLDQEKARAEAATQAKSDFLANMSHEIRTPMNAVIGMSHLALKTDLTPRQKDYIEKVHLSAQSLLRIINDILDFSKIEAGKLDVENISFDLNEVLDNLSRLITAKAQEKGLELIFNLDARVPMFLRGDPLRLGQILLNLSNNALKFTETGEIEVSITPVEINETQAMLKFEVRDTGIGLTPEQTQRIFQSFQQADTSTTRKYGGTGLGLVICKKLSELMGGAIGVESHAGRGSIFWFTARLGRVDKVEKKPEIVPETLNGMKTLVVDDNHTFCQVLTSYLKEFGFQVDTAHSGPQALDMITRMSRSQDARYQLVFMDWQMPAMDGIETARRIRKIQVPAPKVILVTGHGREDIIEESQSAGLDGFLLKPLTQSMLFDAVMEAFGQDDHGTERQKKVLDTPTPQELNGIRGARLLLVEDNKINQQLALELLKGEGFYVEVADNGRAGVDMVEASLENKLFDAVLMDLQMPEMDGRTAASKIRNLDDKSLKDIPIIAMTADAMTGVKEEILGLGMNDYITKPVAPSELYKTLIKWITPRERPLPKQYMASVQTDPDTAGLPPLEGIDTRLGLTRTNGNTWLYKELLVKFHAGHGPAALEFNQAVESGDQKTAVRLAHTVKGLAGTIGARGLQAVAAELEASLKSNMNAPENETLRHNFLTAYEAAAAAVAPVAMQPKTEENNKSLRRGNKEELLIFLKDLAFHVQKYTPKPAKTVLGEMAAFDWPQRYSVKLAELDTMVKKYQFKDAASILNSFISDLEQEE
ncbi:response regulator [uncultured Desulfobacter sp.]|uniref:response regulator n=1 Tax=uncultured Desulfobacter sp. TaxID=240139 RepID=UPI002AAAA1AA|nr:response regulator [uncultured Desulfobacter sp.]